MQCFISWSGIRSPSDQYFDTPKTFYWRRETAQTHTSRNPKYKVWPRRVTHTGSVLLRGFPCAEEISLNCSSCFCGEVWCFCVLRAPWLKCKAPVRRQANQSLTWTGTAPTVMTTMRMISSAPKLSHSELKTPSPGARRQAGRNKPQEKNEL